MTFQCEKCPDGGDVSPTWDGKDWILICDSCDWSRYPTENELKDILGMNLTGGQSTTERQYIIMESEIDQWQTVTRTSPTCQELRERVRSRPHNPDCKQHDEQVRVQERKRLIDAFSKKFRSTYFFFDDVKFDETIKSLRKGAS